MRGVSRPVVGAAAHEYAVNHVRMNLEKRIKEKGPGSYAGRHEIAGVLLEEFDELRAVLQNDSRHGTKHFIAELSDIAVVCLFGIASLTELEL